MHHGKPTSHGAYRPLFTLHSSPPNVAPYFPGARVCIGLSIPGIIFLVIIGVMFDKQGFYTAVEIEDPSAAATECYFAGDE